MDQRVGRIARMGSPHAEVQPYLIAPPASAERLLDLESLIMRKWGCASTVVGSSGSPPLGESASVEHTHPPTSVAQLTESLREILARWRRPASTADSNADLIVAAVETRQSGFVAAVTIEEETRLVVSLGGDVLTDVESQITACEMASGNSIEASNEDVARAEADVRRWGEMECATAMAGIRFSKALGRRRFVNRIDTAIESAPPHSRSSRLAAAARARALVASQQSAAIEAELASLTDSNRTDYDWLQAIAQLCPEDLSRSPRATVRNARIRALLLLRAVG
jgi:hypothetical protein